MKMDADVLVAGGGPAGATTAIRLARSGRRVMLADKDRHPRFHIGESLLPMSMPLLDEIGVLDAVQRMGIRKPGADFPAAEETGYRVFSFDRCLHATPRYAYHVRRAEFDNLLLEAARAEGVTILDETRIGNVAFQSDGVSANGSSVNGNEWSLTARYFVDATGRDTLLSNQLRLKKRNRRHQSAALYAHFSGILRRPGADAGNISIYRTEDGWVWVIPLPDDITSVGLVCGPNSLRGRSGDNAAFLMRQLNSIPELQARLEAPRIVGNLEATGNYSYDSTALTGDRWLMVGDAGLFVDPIFSSGVHFALQGAKAAATLVDSVLTEPASAQRLRRRYEKTVRAAARRVSWFIVRFNTPVMRHLFANPRNVLRIEEALISMLAGDMFRDEGIAWRLSAFKGIYYLHCIARPGDALRGFREVRRRRTETYS